jgi:hypothetical protein
MCIRSCVFCVYMFTIYVFICNSLSYIKLRGSKSVNKAVSKAFFRQILLTLVRVKRYHAHSLCLNNIKRQGKCLTNERYCETLDLRVTKKALLSDSRGVFAVLRCFF